MSPTLGLTQLSNYLTLEDSFSAVSKQASEQASRQVEISQANTRWKRDPVRWKPFLCFLNNLSELPTLTTFIPLKTITKIHPFSTLCTFWIQSGNHEQRFCEASPGRRTMHRRRRKSDRNDAAGLGGKRWKTCKGHSARFVRVWAPLVQQIKSLRPQHLIFNKECVFFVHRISREMNQESPNVLQFCHDSSKLN